MFTIIITINRYSNHWNNNNNHNVQQYVYTQYQPPQVQQPKYHHYQLQQHQGYPHKNTITHSRTTYHRYQHQQPQIQYLQQLGLINSYLSQAWIRARIQLLYHRDLLGRDTHRHKNPKYYLQRSTTVHQHHHQPPSNRHAVQAGVCWLGVVEVHLQVWTPFFIVFSYTKL